jgi:hypothetical protein
VVSLSDRDENNVVVNVVLLGRKGTSCVFGGLQGAEHSVRLVVQITLQLASSCMGTYGIEVAY